MEVRPFHALNSRAVCPDALVVGTQKTRAHTRQANREMASSTTAPATRSPSVAELRTRFNAPVTNAGGLSPSAFEKYRREQAQRSAEELKAAREKARKYNTALRVRTLKRNQLQKAKAEHEAASPGLRVNVVGLPPGVDPHLSPHSQIQPAKDASFEHTIVVDAIQTQAANPLFATSPARPAPTATDNTAAASSPAANPVLTKEDFDVWPIKSPFPEDKNAVTTPVSPFPGEDGVRVVVVDDESDDVFDSGASMRGDRRSTRASSAVSSASDAVAPAPAQPVYEWIRRTVLMNGAGDKHFSMSSVGPGVELPPAEVCRLDPDVDLRTLLVVFYQTYACVFFLRRGVSKR